MKFLRRFCKGALLRNLHEIMFLILLTSPFAYAETTVEDESVTASSTVSATLPNNQRLQQQAQNQIDFLKQVNTLKDQVKDLQGQLEIQAHELKILKDQQKNQYTDLDQRFSELSHQKIESTPATRKKPNLEKTEETPKKAPVDTSNDPSDNKEQKAYQAAYALLKNKHYDKAKTAFQAFIQNYPESENAVNAHYWLANVYLLKSQPAKAVTEFKTVLKLDKTHSKTSDALLKMGLAFAVQGDAKQANIYFKRVKKEYPNSPAAKIASEQLKK